MKLLLLLTMSVATASQAIAAGCIDDDHGRSRADLIADDIPPYRQGVVTTVDPDAVAPWFAGDSIRSPTSIPRQGWR